MNSIQWLDSLANEASFKPGSRNLESIKLMLEALNHPEQSFRAIHITGTAGKGSVAEMITQILLARGESVGTYGSPHVHRINERIRINGKEIEDTAFQAALDEVYNVCQRLKIEPRWFQALTATMFVAFRSAGVTWGVVEVGLGGRLDTTNVFENPALTIITSIGLDHQAFLGNTEAEIAADKAGIFRKNVPALIGEVSPEAGKAIETAARQIGAPLMRASEQVKLSDSSVSLNGSAATISIHNSRFPIHLNLIGQHQLGNAQLAAAAADLLGFSPESIQAGLSRASLPGRLQVLSKDPLIIFDVAHNPMKIAALVESLQSIEPKTRFVTVLGIKQDKDAKEILRLLDPIASKYIFVNLPHTPHWQPSELAKLTPKQSSFELDRNRQSPLLITGSFYLAEIIPALLADR